MPHVELSMAPSRKMASAGFGLVELIVTVALVAILAALALPSFRELGMRMNVSQYTNDVVGALNLARAEAVKRGSPVAVVGTGSDWTSDGWQVIADSNHDGSFGGSDAVLNHHVGFTHDYTITTAVPGGSDSEVAFNAQGSLMLPATQADINVCRPDHETENSRWIHVSPSGEISSQRNTSSSPAPGC